MNVLLVERAAMLSDDECFTQVLELWIMFLPVFCEPIKKIIGTGMISFEWLLNFYNLFRVIAWDILGQSMSILPPEPPGLFPARTL